MLKDAKSLAAAVNNGVFLPGFITAGDPFYMKWSNFIHRTHRTRNYSRVLFFLFFVFRMFSSKQSLISISPGSGSHYECTEN